MAQTKLPSYGGLRDGQFVSVNGPDGITTGFAYDANPVSNMRHTRIDVFRRQMPTG